MENKSYPAPKQEYKVMVQCCTYNQSQYIEDALKGFAMQQTNFPFICCVFDDASTDGEQEVLKSWINSHCDLEHVEVYDHPLTMIHMAPDKNNSNCIYAIHLQKVNTWGKPEKLEMMLHWEKQCEYIALCEGDDYWIDPLKLQKQVDFLDANPEYVLCHTGFKILEDSKSKFIDCTEIIQRNTKFYDNKKKIMEDILNGNHYRIQPMSTLMRLSAYLKVKAILEPYEGKYLMGDTQTWLALLSMGDVYFMPEITSVYRVHRGSACQQIDIKSRLRFDLSCAEMRIEMAELFNLNEECKKKLQKQYQKKLNLYYCYDYKYKPFVELKFANVIDTLQYYTLKTKPIRFLLKWAYEKFI